VKIFYSPYTLAWKQSKGVRNGLLLRIETGHEIGYADCHPWEEFGDLSVQEQLNCLKQGRETPLIKQALNHAHIDARARAEKRSLFSDLHLPKSHLIIHWSDLPEKIAQFAAMGIKFLKVKIKPQDEHLLLAYSSLIKHYGMKWRLDFNATFNPKQVEQFLTLTETVHSTIDLIEDPCPYNEEQWTTLERQFAIPFACDFEAPAQSHTHLLVHKPCTRALPSYSHQSRIIVTSSLGHPIGQLMAAYVAATLPQAKDESGGFLSHLMYDVTPFSQQLSIKDGCLLPPPGTGLGFDTLLEKLTWTWIGNQ
jgi:O-succinylbenzoate synthase